MFRTGKVIDDSFYIVAIGCQSDQIIIDAYDRDKQKRLVLRLDLDRECRQQVDIKPQEASEIVAKLDTVVISTGLALVIR